MRPVTLLGASLYPPMSLVDDHSSFQPSQYPPVVQWPVGRVQGQEGEVSSLIASLARSVLQTTCTRISTCPVPPVLKKHS